MQKINKKLKWLEKRTYVSEGVLVVCWDNVKEAFKDVVKKH